MLQWLFASPPPSPSLNIGCGPGFIETARWCNILSRALGGGAPRDLRHAPNIKIGGRGEEQRSIADNARQNWCNISSMCGTTLRRPGTEVSLALHIRFVVVAVAVAVAVLVVGGGVEHAGAPPCVWKGEEDHRTVRTPEAVGRRGR